MQKLQHPSFSPEGLTKVAFFYLVFLTVDYTVALISLLLDKNEDISLVFLLPLQRIVYRFLFYYISIKSFLTAIKGSHAQWGKLDRTLNAHLSAELKI